MGAIVTLSSDNDLWGEDRFQNLVSATVTLGHELFGQLSIKADQLFEGMESGDLSEILGALDGDDHERFLSSVNVRTLEIIGNFDELAQYLDELRERFGDEAVNTAVTSLIQRLAR